MAQNPLLLLDSQKFNYGTTPKQPVAEQNQTYFAYFDGVGGTGPEYIDGTAYFIKYLIDTEGNVVNPEPYTVVDSPQAVGLYNLVDNFEVGKNAIVKLIEPDPTIDEIPNAEILQGTHRIAHVGRIVPILVTENGINTSDYITTMSFGPLTTQNTTLVVGSPTAQFQNALAEYYVNSTSWTSIPFATQLVEYNNAWDNTSTSTKTINSSSAQTGTRIRFKVNLYVEAGWNGNETNFLAIRILQNSQQIFQSGTDNISNGSSIIDEDTSAVYTSAYSPWIDYNVNDTFVVQAKVNTGGVDRQVRIKGTPDRNQTIWYVEQETPTGNEFDGPSQILFTEGVNAVYSDYIDGVSNFYNSYNGGYTTLTMTPSFYSIYESNLTQNLDPSSAEFGFSEIKIPFSDIKPGDFIRFNYDKTRIHTIYRIRELNFGINTSALALYVTPAISNLDGVDIDNRTLNHFIVYRVVNDGVYVTLDVNKDAPGGAYSGILQPEFVSQELVDNYDKIITNLTEREIIQ
jgi:hypothetical protein